MIESVRRDLSSLVIYRSILEHPVIACLKEICEILSCDPNDRMTAGEILSRLAYHLWDAQMTFQDLIIDHIIYDDNPFSKAAEQMGSQSLAAGLDAAVCADLIRLYNIFRLDLTEYAGKIGVDLLLPQAPPDFMLKSSGIYKAFKASSNWPELIDDLRKHYWRNSRGIVARYRALSWDADNGLKGIKKPDPIRLNDLVGFKSQIQQVLENTEKLLKGFPANHVLLHGPRGTGKSSIIKALLNEFGDQGLRLVELNRDYLGQMDQLVELLQNYKASFIIFIDDLSFEENQTEYKGFKSILEGSLTARPQNVLVYATSNRRHLIREFFADRKTGDEEINPRETMQEKLSLADRFGLSITFPPPSSRLYLEMVEKMADDAGIEMDYEMLRTRALEWERMRHGPSGRTARQFIDSLEQRYYRRYNVCRP